MTTTIVKLPDAPGGRERRRRNRRLAVILGLVVVAFYGGFILTHWK